MAILTCHGIFCPSAIESGPWRGRTTKKARLTEEQIIGILHEQEAGANCADLSRKRGMSEGTFHAWKYSGMTVSEAKRLRALDNDNAKLKKLLGEQMLDMAAMKELLSKNDDARREARGCRAPEGPSQAAGSASLEQTVHWTVCSAAPTRQITGVDRKMMCSRAQRPTRSYGAV